MDQHFNAPGGRDSVSENRAPDDLMVGQPAVSTGWQGGAVTGRSDLLVPADDPRVAVQMSGREVAVTGQDDDGGQDLDGMPVECEGEAFPRNWDAIPMAVMGVLVTAGGIAGFAWLVFGWVFGR